MSAPLKLVRIPALKSVAEFRQHIASLGIDLPCEDAIERAPESPLAQPVENVIVNGKRIGNRIVVHPMEGWDGTTSGGITEEMVRRWQRFGESGAKLIFGGEAMAVRPDGRANPNQHDHDTLPILLAGGGAGRLAGGRHVHAAEGTPFANLLVTVLDKLDVHVESFGDSTGALEV